ncbi:MAG: nucleoside deaminase [Bacteroidetes bacterium]|nr:nucleoside deaminase [Bacteroidota bacterium]
MKNEDRKYMFEAIRLAKEGMNKQGVGPFGAIVVKNGEIIGRGVNQVTSDNDPTAHAEVIAIRDACKTLGHFQLEDCIIYSSCEPCPMCLGAIYWARPEKLFYACSREDAAAINFDDALIYREISLEPEDRKIPGIQLLREEGKEVFKQWVKKEDKLLY